MRLAFHKHLGLSHRDRQGRRSRLTPLFAVAPARQAAR